MNRLFKTILLLALMAVPQLSTAEELSEEATIALQARAKNKVEDFTGYLSDIVNDKLSANLRLECVNSAKALFIGKCEPYSVRDDAGRYIEHIPVRMQVSSVNKKSKTFHYMKKYLMNQYNNIHGYATVTIEATDAVRVDNIHKVGDGKYECMAYWGQRYISRGPDGRFRYGDFTKKGVRIHITAVNVPGEEQTIFEVELGDVYALETERIWK